MDFENMTTDELKKVTEDLILAWRIKFEKKTGDRRKPAAESIIENTVSMIYHIREWKWKVVEACATSIAKAAKEISEIEEEIYDTD